MTTRIAILLALLLGSGAGLIAWWLPSPATLIGTVAVGAAVGLAVLVAYLSWRLRIDEERLAQIERVLAHEVERGR